MSCREASMWMALSSSCPTWMSLSGLKLLVRNVQFLRLNLGALFRCTGDTTWPKCLQLFQAVGSSVWTEGKANGPVPNRCPLLQTSSEESLAGGNLLGQRWWTYEDHGSSSHYLTMDAKEPHWSNWPIATTQVDNRRKTSKNRQKVAWAKSWMSTDREW